MNREAIEQAYEVKRSMQAAIDSGEIQNREQLMIVAASHGLSVTRNGDDYAGFKCESGKRLRVHFQFNDRPPKAPRAKGRRLRKVTTGYWIYALVAQSKDGARNACYVGQAVDLRKRFFEHLHRQREGRCSYALFRWAAREQVDIQATVLTWAEGTQSNAHHYEGYWLQRAQNAGFETPDDEKWGKLPRPESLPGQPTDWPAEKVQAHSISLIEVVMQKLTPKVLYLEGISVGDEDQARPA
ncbi:GIY-YIG nuclease family protein [Pseudomonas fluorescens]|uniref:GIY-YIG nuclease family protein n=1 Tax=Pseudomonas fluorescens TaxID=294 RepID=UPI0017834847|nr:GIY-YIG nuclease family protein [Pseudomonas fluorescens]